MKDSMMARVTGMALLMALFFVIAVQAKQTKTVERGMTREQVLEIYGKPLTTNFNDTIETWRYVKSRGGLLEPYVVLIAVGRPGRSMMNGVKRVSMVVATAMATVIICCVVVMMQWCGLL